MFRITADLLLVAFVAAACSPSPASRSTAAADEQALAAAMKDYQAALESNDAGKIASWWTEDAVFINRAGPTVHGRAALDSMVKGFIGTMRLTSVTVETDEIVVSGDYGYYLGRYDEVLQRQGSAAGEHDRGRFIFIWRRQPDGSWKVARGMGTDLAKP